MKITNTPTEVIINIKVFSLVPATITKISNATLEPRRISSPIFISFHCHFIYQVIHIKQNYVLAQSGLIFISDFVADKSGICLSQFSHLRAFFCLYLPLSYRSHIYLQDTTKPRIYERNYLWTCLYPLLKMEPCYFYQENYPHLLHKKRKNNNINRIKGQVL